MDSIPSRNSLTGEPDAGKRPVRFGGRGSVQPALPTPIRVIATPLVQPVNPRVNDVASQGDEAGLWPAMDLDGVFPRHLAWAGMTDALGVARIRSSRCPRHAVCNSSAPARIAARPKMWLMRSAQSLGEHEPVPLHVLLSPRVFAWQGPTAKLGSKRIPARWHRGSVLC